ncbi:hypothetical protein BVC80_9073g115 [Macleaya cordata]|uniref:Uncharacterized protein n=1 Tax=Macleaya cordata TaxID=56857 RepID=A0A200PTY6_MACCD|nr:hypothetical protein BVC80_9073g115 [Macleaya cordata]
MGFNRANRNVFTVVVFVVFSIFLILISSFQPVQAVRPLQGEEWLLINNKNEVDKINIELITESLQRAPVPPSNTPSTCTTLPGKGTGGSCPIKAAGLMMNFAGGHDSVVVHAPSTAFPDVIVVNSGRSSVVNESRQTQ